MIYLNNFDTHTSYEEKVNVGGIDFKIPNVSYCKDVKDVHFNPYNLIKFYVGEVTGTTPQTVSIYTDATNHIDVTVSEGNKWYSYLLPKDKGLYKISGDTVTKVMVKADITTSGTTIIPSSTVEASFKGSETSKVTNMRGIFQGCRYLTSLDVSNFNTSKVTNMDYMFSGCRGLTSLDLSNFNTSNVTSMNNMFNGCSGLTSLDLSGWNTSNVTNMGGMFNNCSKLTSLDLSGWKISNATSMYFMFSACSKLTSIRMVGCSQDAIGKIESQLTDDRILDNVTIVTK